MQFDRVQKSIKSKVFVVFRFVIASFALAVVSYMVYSIFFDTPREKQMAMDNQRMQEQLAELNARYEQVAAVLKDIEQRDENIFRTIFESEPIPSEAQEAARAITQLYDQVQEKGAEYVVQHTGNLLIQLEDETKNVAKAFDVLVALTRKDTGQLATIPGIQPIDNQNLTRIAAPFGVKMHPFYKVLKMHNGVDFTAPIGTPVKATAEGEVYQVVNSRRGYGNTIIIGHLNGYSTLYAHLDAIQVQKGQKVTRGMQIGTVGNTGMSMAPHLHYEVRLHDTPIDPLNYFFMELDPPKLEKMAQIASQTGQSLD